ncbi:MAG: PEP-CTERM sorting domain-containing protein [Proteobacteria bacterium]|nr:PEP-CTERM sorting domain-containing protein [Pseudomonadota bacterium]
MKTHIATTAAALVLAAVYSLPVYAALQSHDRFTARGNDLQNSQGDQNNQGDQGVPPGAVSDPSAPTSVPEPVTLALLSAGLVGTGLLGRRRK